MRTIVTRSNPEFEGYLALAPRDPNRPGAKKDDPDECKNMSKFEGDPKTLPIEARLIWEECNSEAFKDSFRYHEARSKLEEDIEELEKSAKVCYDTIGLVHTPGLEALLRVSRQVIQYWSVEYHGKKEPKAYKYIPINVLLKLVDNRAGKKSILDFIVELLVKDENTNDLILDLPDKLDRLEAANDTECADLGERLKGIDKRAQEFAELIKNIKTNAANSLETYYEGLPEAIEEGRIFLDSWALRRPKLHEHVDAFMGYWPKVTHYLLYQPILCPPESEELAQKLPVDPFKRAEEIEKIPLSDTSKLKPCENKKTSSRLLYLTLEVLGKVVKESWLKMAKELEGPKKAGKDARKADILADLLRRVPRIA